jgi:NADH-quinone oxidoreductase subunit C
MFYNHTNLQRLLADYGFLSCYLRKDFPLSGFSTLRYYEKNKRFIYKPFKQVKFRKFNFLNV